MKPKISKAFFLISALFLTLISAKSVEAKTNLTSLVPAPKDQEGIFVASKEYSSTSQKEKAKTLFENTFGMDSQEFAKKYIKDIEKKAENLSEEMNKSLYDLFFQQKNLILSVYFNNDFGSEYESSLFLIDLEGDFSPYDEFFSNAAKQENFTKKDNYYSFDDYYFARDGSIFYISDSETLLKRSINMASSDSLKNFDIFEDHINKISGEYFLWFFMYNKIKESGIEAEQNTFAVVEAKNNGVSIRTNQAGNKDFLDSIDLELPALGKLNGEPELLDLAPKGETVLYTEIKNLSFYIEIMIKAMKKEMGEDDYYASEEEYVEENILPLFEKNTALFFQIFENFPSITVVLDVSGNEEIAKNDIEELDGMMSLYTISLPEIERDEVEFEGGDFLTYTINIKDQLQDDEIDIGIDEIKISFGVTKDGLMIISTHPDIFENFRGSDIELSEVKDYGNSFGYFDFKPLIKFIDKFSEEMDISEIKDFFYFKTMISIIDDFSLSQEIKENLGGASEVFVKLKEIEYMDFSDWAKEEKGKDTDSDLLSDFEEKFIFETDYQKADSDGDGVSDGEEILENKVPTANENNSYFEDVVKNHFAQKAVMALKSMGVVKGYEDGKYFKPGEDATRAEVLTMALRTFNKNTYFDIYKYSDNFSDVNPEDWYAGYIGYAKSTGIITGYKDGTFKPNQSITRAEALSMILSAASISESEKQGSESFVDTKQDDWYFDIASFAKEKGIMSGRDGNFAGNALITRAEVAVIIYNTILI